MRGMRRKFNQKRKLLESKNTVDLCQLARRVKYTGNPAHKKNPGDFGLDPPAGLRADKTLCDDVGIHSMKVARRLLQEGVRRGLISENMRGGFPQTIWAVSDEGHPLEAQLENQGLGTYRGYPIPPSDPFQIRILERWEKN